MLLYAALFAASVMILFGVVYWQTVGYMRGQLRQVVTTNLQSLKDIYQEGGAAALRSEVHDRLADSGSRTASYLLEDARGKVLEGNVPRIEPATGWREVVTGGGDEEEREEHTVYGRGEVLDNGWFVFAAESAFDLEEMRELLIGGIGWALGVMVFLAVIGGILMSVGVLHRVDAINRIADDVMRGDFSRRIPTRGSDDEFDLLARNLNAMLDRIQRLMEGLRQVSSDIAHDLRTPLGRLRQRLEAARHSGATLNDYRQAVDQAISDTDQILETFGALLRIAQIEAGSQRARFTRVDLSEVGETVLDAYTAVAEESGRTLRGQVSPGVVALGDRDLLMQVFANLIENALHHTPDGSHIDLTVSSSDGRAIAAVADNGPGIPADARSKVLQRFWRLESSRTTPGSGLGLSLVAAVAELHGAELVLSDNGPGLRVTLRFPS